MTQLDPGFGVFGTNKVREDDARTGLPGTDM